MMNRRRALMGAQGGSNLLVELKDLMPGTVVKFSKDSSIRYIVVKSYVSGQVLLLREYCIGAKNMSNGTSYANYENTQTDVYLSTTFYDLFSDIDKARFIDFNFTFRAYNANGELYTNELTRKIFVPDSSMVSDTGIVTTALKAFRKTTSANTARKGYTSATSNSVAWYTSSAYDATHMTYVSADGANGFSGKLNNNKNVWSLFSLKANEKARLNGDEYILQ